MRESLFAQLWSILKSLMGECCQFLRSEEPVVEDEPHHCPSAGFGPYGLHLEVAVALPYVEERMDDLNLPTDSVPVEQMLIFFGGKVNQDAVICLLFWNA